ncbi:hypothetical protein M408DRAFT_131429 [Serendipita vermifera MAFF 305830]|uniref:FAD-binding PCMH-type domain-containing protein n=1 Tax=Serendipita vermifera MAFF 305830 TaxID=933852 RepID=A0A0C3BB81_SERVB|nr:hypothetical protein M408DRAFT_131429 [Serendipita vermifera MAFF 305830]
MIYLVVQTLVALSLVAASQHNQPCTYPNACWPSDGAWSSLNRTLQGGLVRARPPAAPCHVNSLNDTACNAVKENWNLGLWRGDQPGAYFDTAWENGNSYCNIDNDPAVPCDQGLVPIYMAQVKNSADVQAAVSFARDHDLSTRVKGASHDFLGRSSGNGTFGIQTIKLKGIEFDDTFRPKGSPSGTASQTAVHIAAGEHWYYVNKAASEHGVVVVGGSSYSVGAAGGWVLGGGHSSLSPQYGLGVDNVLQFEIVTPDSQLRTANRFLNKDLFWALRGGGPGFGVVTKVTYKTHPAITAISAFSVDATYTKASQHGFLKTLLTLQPALAAHNFSGYMYPSPTNFTSYLLVHNSADISGANATFQPLYDFAEAETGQGRPVTITSVATVLTEYLQMWGQDPLTVSEDGAARSILLGSRLAPMSAFEEPQVDAMVSFMENLGDYEFLQFHLIAGGRVNQVPENATAVHPSWRRASHHIIVATGWLTDTPFAARDLVRQGITNRTQALASIVPSFGAYVNEADINEPNWAETFWGPNYPRLRSIKSVIDPRGLFTCHHCVGDE